VSGSSVTKGFGARGGLSRVLEGLRRLLPAGCLGVRVKVGSPGGALRLVSMLAGTDKMSVTREVL